MFLVMASWRAAIGSMSRTTGKRGCPVQGLREEVGVVTGLAKELRSTGEELVHDGEVKEDAGGVVVSTNEQEGREIDGGGGWWGMAEEERQCRLSFL